MSSARSHIRNLMFNWGGHATTLMVMFFLSPFIVGKLDAVSYGIWSLLSVLTGYMGIFDLGVRASVGRHVALYLGKGDERGVDETIRAGFGVFTLTGGLILLVGILLGWLFPTLFKGISPEYYDTVRYLLPLLVVNVWFSAIAAIFSSVLAAHDRFDVARGVDLVVLIIRTVTTVYALLAGWGLWGLAGSLIVSNFCAVIGNRFYAGRVHLGLRSFPFLYARNRLKELFGYGFASFITSAAVKIIGQSDLVIVGAVLSVSDVREYSVGAMLLYYSATFILLIRGTFFPSIQRAVSGGTLVEVRHLLLRQLQVSLCVGLLAYVGLVLYAQPFMNLWMLQDGFDQRAVASAAGVMTLLALSKFPSLYIIPCQSVLAAIGHVHFNAVLSMIEAAFNILFSLFFVLVLEWGIAGVAAGTLVARLVVPSFWVPFYLCRKVEVIGWKFFVSVVVPGVFASGLLSLICVFFLRFWMPETWVAFCAHVLLVSFLWGLIAVAFLLPVDVRRRVAGRVISTLSKRYVRS